MQFWVFREELRGYFSEVLTCFFKRLSNNTRGAIVIAIFPPKIIHFSTICSRICFDNSCRKEPPSASNPPSCFQICIQDADPVMNNTSNGEYFCRYRYVCVLHKILDTVFSTFSRNHCAVKDPRGLHKMRHSGE